MAPLFFRTHLSKTSSNVKSKSFFFILGKKTSFLSDLSELVPRFTSLLTMENKQNKSKTMNAERCKRYQEKHSEEYRNQDALRKKRLTLILKSNNAAHEEYKRKEKERKRTAKLRKNALNNQPLEPSTSFSSAAVKSRSNKKVEKSLPKGPLKKREVITKLTSKLQDRVKFTEKAGRKKNVLSVGEVDWVMAFLNRPDSSYTWQKRQRIRRNIQ